MLTTNKEKTLKRKFGNLLKTQDNYLKYVVTMDEFDGNTFDSVQCLSLREVLKVVLGRQY